MKTPIQELIEWNNSRDRYSMITWIELNAKLTELHEKEKQDRIDLARNAFFSGCRSERQIKPREKC